MQKKITKQQSKAVTTRSNDGSSVKSANKNPGSTKKNNRQQVVVPKPKQKPLPSSSTAKRSGKLQPDIPIQLDSQFLSGPIDTEIMVGAHANGGIKGAVAKAQAIGAHTIQIFIGSPQMWKHPSPRSEELELFRQGSKKHLPGPVFVHGNYLVNLASSSAENRAKSIANLHHALRIADVANATGLIFHPGSAGTQSYEDAVKVVITAVEEVLEDYTGNCKLLLEVCAGQGQTIGDRFSEFRDILSGMGYDQRLGVCWDTCHLYNAGYDVGTADGLERTVDEFEKEVGFEWLFAVHANDSKHPLGARRDRHENIGRGYIGEAAFQRMLQHPLLRKLPWILEVPGLDNKGPDQHNINLLRRLAYRG